MTCNHRLRSLTGCVVVLGLVLLNIEFGHGIAAAQQDPMAEFNKRVQEYVAIHKKVASAIPNPKTSDDPALILKNQHALAEALQKVRPKAMQGDIFVETVRPAFLSLIKQKLDGKSGEPARKTVLGEGNPKSPESAATVKLAVNAIYPPSAPMSTVPPSLLMVLPTLPEVLEFRFVGRNLILRDTKANLIVDILPDAVAAGPEK